MKELKVFLSPFHEGDFHDEVSGITFTQNTKLEVHGISLEDKQLEGIQKALRKNILLPFDLKTRDFVNSENLVKEEAPVEEVKEVEVVEVVEEVVFEAKEVKAPEAPKKAPRKRAPKKEESK